MEYTKIYGYIADRKTGGGNNTFAKTLQISNFKR